MHFNFCFCKVGGTWWLAAIFVWGADDVMCWCRHWLLISVVFAKSPIAFSLFCAYDSWEEICASNALMPDFAILFKQIVDNSRTKKDNLLVLDHSPAEQLKDSVFHEVIITGSRINYISRSREIWQPCITVETVQKAVWLFLGNLFDFFDPFGAWLWDPLHEGRVLYLLWSFKIHCFTAFFDSHIFK